MINFYENKKVKKFVKVVKNPSFDATQIELRSRLLCVGASGTGKTNFLVNYLVASPMTFGKVIIVSKLIEEPLYQFLKDELKGSIVFYSLDQLPSLNEYTDSQKGEEMETLIVFDDLVNDLKKDSKVKDYFIAGRKCGLTMLFLTQSYYKVEKVIRGQLNYLIMLKVSSGKDLKMILSDYSLGITPDELVEIHTEATKEPLSFLKIDINTPNKDKKFSQGFKDFF
jgi:ABC-type oligopeptide transport system ATPase subunit